MSFEIGSMRLRELSSRITKGTTPVKGEGFVARGINYIKSECITADGSIEASKFAFIDPETHGKLFRSQLRAGNVLFSMAGVYLGKTAVVLPKHLPANTNQAVGIITLDEEKADPYFIHYSLQSPTCRAWVLRSAAQSAQPNFNLQEIGDLKIPALPLACQKEIASVLRTLDDRINLLRETNTTLEAIAQALFKSWFVDFDPVHAKQQGREPEGMDASTAALFPDSFEESELGLVPTGWRVLRLGDVTERITKGTTPTTLKRPFVESGINFIKVESLTEDGEFIPGKFAHIDAETHEMLKRSQLKTDDVLITIAGTIGRIAVMTEDFLPANTNQAVALIRPNTNVFPGGLIKHFLQREDSRQTMGERVVQAVQANLSLGSLSDLKVVVPPEEIIGTLYATGIEQVDACKRNNQQQIRTLTNLRDTLLPRLISGQLRLPDIEIHSNVKSKND